MINNLSLRYITHSVIISSNKTPGRLINSWSTYTTYRVRECKNHRSENLHLPIGLIAVRFAERKMYNRKHRMLVKVFA